jgi:hypothetical protein
MILSFDEYINEEYTNKELSDKTSRYTYNISLKRIKDAYKKLRNEESVYYNEELSRNIFKAYNNFIIGEISQRDMLFKIVDLLNANNISDVIIEDFYNAAWNNHTNLKDKSEEYFKNKYAKDRDMSTGGNEDSKYLYHYTTVEHFMYIMDSDKFMVHQHIQSGVCFSTDPDLYAKGFEFMRNKRNDKRCGIKMKLDFGKMKEDGYSYLLGGHEIGTEDGENEIRITTPVTDIRKYLLVVEVYPNKIVFNGENYKRVIKYLKDNNIPYRIRA